MIKSTKKKTVKPRRSSVNTGNDRGYYIQPFWITRDEEKKSLEMMKYHGLKRYSNLFSFMLAECHRKLESIKAGVN